MKYKRYLLSILCVAISACTPPVTKVDIGRLQADVVEIRSGHAAHTAQLSTIDAQLRRLAGRMDELEHAQSGELRVEVSSLRENLSLMQRRLPPPAIVPTAALEEDESIAGNGSDEFSKLFSSALSAIRGGGFAEARRFLDAAVATNPSRDELAMLSFWIAVSAEGAGDLRGALNQYYEIAEKYPKHPRAALTLLRQGNVLVRLGDPKTAQLIFKKIVAEYPKTAEAERARERLKAR